MGMDDKKVLEAYADMQIFLPYHCRIACLESWLGLHSLSHSHRVLLLERIGIHFLGEHSNCLLAITSVKEPRQAEY